MNDRPIGTVTLLFTDIEGSTRLLQRLGDGYAAVLSDHHRILRAAIRDHHGIEVKTEGDSFFAVFRTPTDGVAASVAAQRALSTHAWPPNVEVRVRMGLHTGDVDLSDGQYVGLDVHKGARISAAAHGGQVIVSHAVRQLAGGALPEDVSLRDLGEHRLRDLERPERLHQLSIKGLRDEFPPPATLDARLDVLPPQLTSFVGREHEVEEVERLLPRTRLLTLTGPGGTGKTRLALAVARRARERFHNGIVFVELASIMEPALVTATLRRSIGEAEEPGRPALDTVVDALSDKEVLVVLDNFEHLLPAAASIGELLSRTEQLTVITTSRAVLHLTGEQEYSVPPLALPTQTETADLDRLAQSEAVSLFVQRAQTVRPDFQLTPANARDIVEICRRLDGLPLAIELAATRVKLLPPDALLARLQRRLDLLQATSADRTDRQRTLRGAIDWSYGLLTADLQALFRRLAVFRGGATIESATAVAEAAGPVGDVMDGLAALVDHSLVRQAEAAGEPRFRMLETIREFGLEQLAATDELATTAAAHAAHFRELAASAEPHLTAAPEWLDRLEREHDDIRAALLGLETAGEVEAALSMAGGLWRFWHLRGHLREGSRRLRDLLASPGATAPTGARAKGLIGLAGLVYWMGDFDEAAPRYEEAMAIAERLGDVPLQAEVAYSLGYVRAIDGGYDAGVEALSTARRIYLELGDARGATSSQMAGGMILTLRGDHGQAVTELREAIRSFESLGDEFGRLNAMLVMGRALVHLGRLEEARRVAVEVLERSAARREPTAMSGALLDLAAIDTLTGKPERAARLVGAGERIVEESGGQAPPTLVNRIDPLPRLRQDLGEERLEALRRAGRLWSTDDAVSFALSDLEAPIAAQS